MILAIIIGIIVLISAVSMLLWILFSSPEKVRFMPLRVLKYNIPGCDMDKIVYHVRIIHDRLTRDAAPIESESIKPFRAIDIYHEDTTMSQCAKMALPICIGKDQNHNLHFADLARLPHVLIAGLTGFGKSMCFQNFIYWLGKSKNKVEVHAIDPKQTGFSRFIYSKKPMISVIFKEKAYTKKLGELVDEMNDRNALMRKLGFKDIGDYNCSLKNKLPYIVLMIDEFQDLERKQQDGLKKLARMGRSAGIHLVLGTQNPNGVDIDPTILQQLAGIVSFRLRNQSASKRILGDAGAEKLANKGEMIFKSASDCFKGRAPLAELKDFEFYEAYKKDQQEQIEAFLASKENKLKRGRPKKQLI